MSNRTLLLLALAPLALAGCRGDRSDKAPRQFFPDMDDSPKWKNQEGSEFFADGRMMRPPPANTVAFGRFAFVSDEPWASDFMTQRDDLLREDDALYQGYTERGVVKAADGTETERLAYVNSIPNSITVDEALIARGQERFSIYCAACHGIAGDGKGMVGTRWSAAVPSFHDPKYSTPGEPDGKNTDGFLFVTARLGVPGVAGLPMPGDTPQLRREKLEGLKMPGYAHALSERDTWAVVAYIRVLQESRRGTPADVPADQRDALEQARRDLISRAAGQPGAGAQR